MTKARDISSLIGSSGQIDNTKITLDANEIPALDTSKITTGELPNARIADLPASKITTGTIASARIDNTFFV
jgi:UDP-3-O-acyl-N-acetylglucosamine deacetylase